MLVIPGGPGENYGLRQYSYNKEPTQPYILKVAFPFGVISYLDERLQGAFNLCLTKPDLDEYLKEIVNQNVLFKDFNYSGPFRIVYGSHRISGNGFSVCTNKPIFRWSQLPAPIEKYVYVKANELDKDNLKALLTNNTVFLECSKEDFPALYTELGGSEDNFINLFRV